MPRLLIVDDDAALRSWARRVLDAQGYACSVASNSDDAREALAREDIGVALLDVNMPGESGIDLLARVRAEYPGTAVLMLTGEDDLGVATASIELGAYGYMVKPVRAGELVINVVNALYRRRREADMRRRVERLEGNGEDTEEALRRALASSDISSASAAGIQNDAMRRLVRLAEFRDAETGQHMVRMGRYCELLARQRGLPRERCAQLRLASELHDIGKVAIADRILLKPGKLTVAEFEVLKTHAEVGYQLLADSDTALMSMAATVAWTHHERWDGGGYPHGLAGERIPLEGRIAAVADVFDALTSDRVYRPALPVAMAVEMMESERARHFEPALLDAMHASFDHIEEARRQYAD